jgi:N-acetylmuramoyl-L-alanine amidase
LPSCLGLALLLVALVGCRGLARADEPSSSTTTFVPIAAAPGPSAEEPAAPAEQAPVEPVPAGETPGTALGPADPAAGPAPPEATAELAPPGIPAPQAAPHPPGVTREPTGEPRRAPDGRVRTIALDPGHGGPEIGAVSGALAEKHLNLQIALLLADMLVADGFRVVLTRDSDRAVHPDYVQPGVRGQVTLDLQARVDIANAAQADLFLSIHNNGSGDPGQRGTEVWYNNQRPFADRNQALAELVLDGILRHLAAIGHPTFNRGIKDDTFFRIIRGRAFNIYVLGPGDGPRPHVPTAMPGVLGESLFLSNPTDVAALRRPETLAAIARGYREAVLAYFARFPQ